MRDDPVKLAENTTDEIAALEFSGVSHRYGDVLAVDRLDLSVREGEVMCLLGPSGCGKTTVLRLAAGLEQLQEGEIAIAGRRVAAGGMSSPPESRGVGLVFQDYALFPHLSVLDNVTFGLQAVPAANREDRALRALRDVGMEEHAARFPHMLSGGQQQRVALARALVAGPSVVLLDEPFSGLDARLRDKVRDQTLHALLESQAATLMVTHDAEEAMFMADRIAVMREGRVLQTGTPDELYCRPATAFVAQLFGEVNRLEGVVSDGGVVTPFGPQPAAGLPEGAEADILIRPEALYLSKDGKGPSGRVITSHMLGRSSLVHLSVEDGTVTGLHLHARMPGRFLPEEGQLLSVTLDTSQTFVFPAGGIK
ncbi:MAG: ABC transporter ATP-binding protein [Alphaproteobacteria bacterium]|nr:ABC transporter ATP-binding protein [Alphaproteobacteria bacterium]